MSLFDDKNTTPASDPNGESTPAASQAPSATDQLLAGIKNDSGAQKYANVEEALKALQHSQEFIATLKQEKESLSSQVKSQEQLQELLNARPEVEAPAPVQEQPTPAQVVPGLTSEDVIAILKQQESVSVANANAKKVTDALESAYGAEAQTTLVAKVEAVGLSREMADKLAQESPDAFLKMIGVEANKSVPKAGSAFGTESFNQPKKPEPYKFIEQMQSSNKNLEAWRKSAEETKARLGL
jgi:hypothetical protein